MKYAAPICEIYKFNREDIIATSPTDTPWDDTPGNPPTDDNVDWGDG